MATKRELAGRIWSRIAAWHRDPQLMHRLEGLPEMIPGVDGKSITIPTEAGSDIEAFTRLVHDSDNPLRRSFGSKDMREIVRRAFGTALTGMDLDTPDDVAAEVLLAAVGDHLLRELSKPALSRVFAFGCWLVREQDAIDLSFGPVRFESRSLWLDRMLVEGRMPSAMHSRIARRWAGKAVRPLKTASRRWREDAFLQSVGPCPVVCSVATEGLGSGAAREKAFLAARLGLTAVALLWERPSKALDGFGLLIDGEVLRRSYLILGEPGAMTAANDTVRHVGSTWVTSDDWSRIWLDRDWLVAPVGELLAALVDATRSPARPDVVRPLLHALWWMHEACRAEAPLMAAAKFGTCLDILAGGRSEGDILSLVRARLNAGPDDPVTRDGQSARSVVRAIYGEARSRTMHGSNERYDEDWTRVRDLAEHLTRRCFAELLVWLEEHPDVTDLSGARVAER